MVVLSKDGRRCDERCYNAKGLMCTCVCNGKNHGKGVGYALREAWSGRQSSMKINFEVHGTRSGRFDSTKPHASAMAKTFEEHFGAKNT